MGYAVEFKREDEIFSEYGKYGISEYDYTIHVPELKLFFRDAVDFEFDEEEHDDLPIEAILHCYRDGNTEPMYGFYESRSHVLWYIQKAGISLESPDELECVIDFLYDVDLKEDEK